MANPSPKRLPQGTNPIERATPPSPSNAPEVDELPAPPTLPRYLLDMIGEYGMARTDSVGQLEVQHRWEILIGGIKRYASEYGRALASRPAEVDEEGLPPLPEGTPIMHIADETGSGSKAYTAEQYRQGQRDAVAADRARRGDINPADAFVLYSAADVIDECGNVLVALKVRGIADRVIMPEITKVPR